MTSKGLSRQRLGLLDDVRAHGVETGNLPGVTFTAGVAHCSGGDLKDALRRADALM
ncbi:hypothetical protein [Deinococcus sp.]|uniref:hypothetical protein n=1 Tax=Deinococcus sp. TaxID=47478 RepID=UPI002869C232|nr:hypothetical protein [Deinococcus sp.]